MHTAERLLILGLPLLLCSPGCFNPDYGDGGFLCSEPGSTCPEGYSCSKGVCRKDGVDPGDGCTVKEAVFDVSPGKFRWSLVLDDKGEPRVYFIDPKRVVKEAVQEQGAWKVKDVVLYGGTPATADHVAAEVDGGPQTVLVFADSSHTTEPWPNAIWRKRGSTNWSKHTAVDQGLLIKTNGLALDTNGVETFLAVTGEDRTAGSTDPGRHEVYRWDTDHHRFTKGPLIAPTKEVPNDVRVSVGKYVVSTVSEALAWKTVRFLPNQTATAVQTSTKVTGSYAAPVAVAAADTGNVYLARGREGKGGLTTKLVLMELDTSDSKLSEIPANITLKADRHTVAMAAAPKTDTLFLSFVDITNTKAVSMMMVDGKAKAPLVLDTISSTTSTQIKVGHNGVVNGIYDREDSKGKISLYHFSCK